MDCSSGFSTWSSFSSPCRDLKLQPCLGQQRFHPPLQNYHHAFRVTSSALSSPQREGENPVTRLTPATIFKVAGAAAAIAAIVFSLPIGNMETQRTGTTKKREKKAAIMPLEERWEWTKGLPLVQQKIVYTDLVTLKEQGKLKHIIKHPISTLQRRPDIVFVVLDDDRVLRTVLPAKDRDTRFWNAWKELNLDSFVLNAYTPPAPLPEQPSLLFWHQPSPPPKKKQQQTKKVQPQKDSRRASRARVEELKNARKELEKAKVAREEARKRQQELTRKIESEKKARIQAAKKLQKQKIDEGKLAQQMQASIAWEDFCYRTSRNEGFRFILGMFFFFLFYQVVVLGVKKRRQDYEDRVKIEKAEEEERKKMAKWEEEMDTAQLVSTMNAMGKETLSEAEKKRLEEVEQNPQIQLGLQFMRSGARVRRAKGQRPPKYLDLGADVKFSDVAGLGEIRKELEEIVDFFTYKERYQRRGSKIPSGILLCGEPGTGKTLLAKAVAGEAGVNFFSISASQFVEIYVGVGASRVRALYQEAKENAPAVVFIDELDAVGRQRGLIGGSGGQERDATLNQLLTCLDGFEGKGDVITIAATNRPDILDTALVRPGRFDRKIYIPKPSVKGRVEILKVHARNKPMADDVDYYSIADITDGMVGAQLANLLDIAALRVLRDGRAEITTDDLIQAVQLEEGGYPDMRPRSDDLWQKLALNEAATAVAAMNFSEFRDIQLLTVIPRMGEEKGSIRMKVDRSKFESCTLSRQSMLDYITLQLAPRAADEICHGRDQMNTIWADSYDLARKAARDFVIGGLSEREDFYGLVNCWNELDRLNEVDTEALKILDSCYKRAIKILTQNQLLVSHLVDTLLEQKVMRKEKFWELVNQYGILEKIPPQAMDVRNVQLHAFQEEMISQRRSAKVK